MLGDIFRFLYAALLRCFCCLCRTYTRKRRRMKRRVRAGKVKVKDDIDYTGTATLYPSWPEVHRNDDDKFSDEEYDDEDEDVWDRIEGRVPFGAVILIIIGYICLGAVMFNRFEGWTMIESVYFCYITLSTIGFGDYVCSAKSHSKSYCCCCCCFSVGTRNHFEFNIGLANSPGFALHSFWFSYSSNVLWFNQRRYCR